MPCPAGTYMDKAYWLETLTLAAELFYDKAGWGGNATDGKIRARAECK